MKKFLLLLAAMFILGSASAYAQTDTDTDVPCEPTEETPCEPTEDESSDEG